MLFKNKQNYFCIQKNNKTLKPFMLNVFNNFLITNTGMCSLMYSVMSFFTTPVWQINSVQTQKRLPTGFKNIPLLAAGALIPVEEALLSWVVHSIFLFVLFYTSLYMDWLYSNKYRREFEKKLLGYQPHFRHNSVFRLVAGCFLFNGFIFYVNYSFMIDNSFTPLMLAVGKDECLVIVVLRFVLGLMFLCSLIITLVVLIYVFSENQKKLRLAFLRDLFNCLDYWLHAFEGDAMGDFDSYMCKLNFSFRFIFIFCYVVYILGSLELFADFLCDFFTYIHPARNTTITNFNMPIKFRLIGTFLHIQFLNYVLWPNANEIVINRRLMKRNVLLNSLVYRIRLFAGLIYLLFIFYIVIYLDEWKNTVDLQLTFFFHLFMFLTLCLLLFHHYKQTIVEFIIHHPPEYSDKYGRFYLDYREYDHINIFWQFYTGLGHCLWFFYMIVLALGDLIVHVLFNFKIFTQVTFSMCSLYYLLTLYKNLFWLFVSVDEVLFMNSLTTQLFMLLLVLYILIPPLLFFYLCYLMFKVSKTLE